MNKSTSPSLPVPIALLDTLGIQFSLGKFNSLVSSILTTLASGGMKKEIALSKVVFPEDVPPAISIFVLYWTKIQK